MKNLLFVDDDVLLLNGLKRMLRVYRKEWRLHFANSATEALMILKAESIDLVVSDFHMPGINGASFLAQVKTDYPDIIRIILTGHAEMETVLNAVPLANNFLEKPCQAQRIKEVVFNAFEIQAKLNDKTLRRKIGALESLPAVPKTYAALVDALQRENVTADEIAGIVERDIAISSKVLQTVNSGFFGLHQTVTEIKSAINFIGVRMLKTLVLSVEIFQQHDIKSLPFQFSLEDEQRHAILVAQLASKLDPQHVDPGQAFLAGLLHDIGKLVVASQLPNQYTATMKYSIENLISFHEAEQEMGNLSHTEIGAYLLHLWGFPFSIIDAISLHHSPEKLKDRDRFDLSTVVYIANRLAHIVDREKDNFRLSEEKEKSDEDLLALPGVAPNLPAWKNLTEELVTMTLNAA